MCVCGVVYMAILEAASSLTWTGSLTPLFHAIWVHDPGHHNCQLHRLGPGAASSGGWQDPDVPKTGMYVLPFPFLLLVPLAAPPFHTSLLTQLCEDLVLYWEAVNSQPHWDSWGRGHCKYCVCSHGIQARRKGRHEGCLLHSSFPRDCWSEKEKGGPGRREKRCWKLSVLVVMNLLNANILILLKEWFTV